MSSSQYKSTLFLTMLSLLRSRLRGKTTNLRSRIYSDDMNRSRNYCNSIVDLIPSRSRYVEDSVLFFYCCIHIASLPSLSHRHHLNDHAVPYLKYEMYCANSYFHIEPLRFHICTTYKVLSMSFIKLTRQVQRRRRVAFNLGQVFRLYIIPHVYDKTYGTNTAYYILVLIRIYTRTKSDNIAFIKVFRELSHGRLQT